MGSIGKSKRSLEPPLGLELKSGALLASWSRYACALLPCVVMKSAPAEPSMSCQPNGDAIESAGLETSVRAASSGLSFGHA